MVLVVVVVVVSAGPRPASPVKPLKNIYYRPESRERAGRHEWAHEEHEKAKVLVRLYVCLGSREQMSLEACLCLSVRLFLLVVVCFTEPQPPQCSQLVQGPGQLAHPLPLRHCTTRTTTLPLQRRRRQQQQQQKQPIRVCTLAASATQPQNYLTVCSLRSRSRSLSLLLCIINTSLHRIFQCTFLCAYLLMPIRLHSSSNSLIHSLTHSLTHSYTHSLSHSYSTQTYYSLFPNQSYYIMSA